MTDDAFLARFEAGNLQSFDHRDHLRVAFAYARRGGIDHAVDHARRGLRHLAAAHGEPDRYHETLTTAWARVIAHHALADGATGFDAFLAAHPRLPADLRQKLLQSADELRRTVAIRARYAGGR